MNTLVKLGASKISFYLSFPLCNGNITAVFCNMQMSSAPVSVSYASLEMFLYVLFIWVCKNMYNLLGVS